ncbi:DUF4834 family protein [Mucilaginibacter calamicampi]|uniref:DUF4834 family protein n=1 Tax=Mucilaginibacter calamicampi TaxID=1302352 RepID=A0ABW2YVH7_9SPHI
MSVLLRFLLVAIVILYIIRALLRYLLPMLFQSLVNKAQQGQQNNSRPNGQKPTGKINIDYIPQEATKSKVPDTEGDFVEYEEIKVK